VAATAMRRVLTDDARSRLRRKRGSGALQVPLINVIDSLFAPAVEPAHFDRALDDLALRRPRTARVLELRALGGMTVAETARVLRISASTVKREWAAGLAYLRQHATRGISDAKAGVRRQPGSRMGVETYEPSHRRSGV